MAFRDNFKLEEKYYNNLKTLIVPLNDIRKKEKDRDTKEVLDTLIHCVGAILQIFRHLGEEYNVLSSFIQKNADQLKELEAKGDAYHDELNEKIDEVNNYLLSLIRELEVKIENIRECKCYKYYIAVDETEQPIIVDENNNQILYNDVDEILNGGGNIILIGPQTNVFYLSTMGYRPTDYSGFVWEHIEAPFTSGTNTGIYFHRFELNDVTSQLVDRDYFLPTQSNI